MNARGLIELILLNIGLQAGIITPTLFTILVLVAIVTTLMATPIFEFVYGRHRKSSEDSRSDQTTRRLRAAKAQSPQPDRRRTMVALPIQSARQPYSVTKCRGRSSTAEAGAPATAAEAWTTEATAEAAKARTTKPAAKAWAAKATVEARSAAAEPPPPEATAATVDRRRLRRSRPIEPGGPRSKRPAESARRSRHRLGQGPKSQVHQRLHPRQRSSSGSSRSPL